MGCAEGMDGAAAPALAHFAAGACVSPIGYPTTLCGLSSCRISWSGIDQMDFPLSLRLGSIPVPYPSVTTYRSSPLWTSERKTLPGWKRCWGIVLFTMLNRSSSTCWRMGPRPHMHDLPVGAGLAVLVGYCVLLERFEGSLRCIALPDISYPPLGSVITRSAGNRNFIAARKGQCETYWRLHRWIHAHTPCLAARVRHAWLPEPRGVHAMTIYEVWGWSWRDYGPIATTDKGTNAPTGACSKAGHEWTNAAPGRCGLRRTHRSIGLRRL